MNSIPQLCKNEPVHRSSFLFYSINKDCKIIQCKSKKRLIGTMVWIQNYKVKVCLFFKEDGFKEFLYNIIKFGFYIFSSDFLIKTKSN